MKKAAESGAAELRLSLQKEHERAEALTSELSKAQRDIETQVALSSKAADEVAQLKQLKDAAERATAELRLSLQQERDRVQALAAVREPAQSKIGAQTAVERASNSQIAEGDTTGSRCDSAASGRRSARQSGSGRAAGARQRSARPGKYRCSADRARARCRDGKRTGKLHARGDI